MKRLILWIGTSSLLLMILSGCIKLTSHVTVNSNGSADVEYIFAMDPKIAELAKSAPGTEGKDPFAEMHASFVKDGFKVVDYTEKELTGLKATKHVKNTKELAEAMATSALDSNESVKSGTGGSDTFKKVGDAIAIKRGLFTTSVKMHAVIDMSLPKDRMFDMSFMLTLPVKPKKTNAAKISDKGRTLEWPLKVGEQNDLQAEVVIPNYTNIGLVGGGILLVLMLLGITLREKTLATGAYINISTTATPSTTE